MALDRLSQTNYDQNRVNQLMEALDQLFNMGFHQVGINLPLLIENNG